MCEDLGAEPLFVINCGMSHSENVPMDKMGEFVQDALDAIEYANGPADSKWGAVRAKAGHPAPFDLKYMEIGNENGGPAYQERYALFYDAIKAKYPEIALDRQRARPTSGRPTSSTSTTTTAPSSSCSSADTYDKYDRKGPKIYVGEYAVTPGLRPGQPARRRRRGGLHDRHGAQLRRRRHGLLRAAVRQREPQAAGTRT